MPPLPPLRWSQPIEDLYRDEVTLPIINDGRSDISENMLLGYPFPVIRDRVIAKGLADFTVGYQHKLFGDLTSDEKVLLYCFVNMKLHYFETLSSFRAFKVALQRMFHSNRPTWMIDLGCGPGTAGLALADCFTQPILRYIGLDISRAMLRKTKSILETAIKRSLFDDKSKILTTCSWRSLQKAPDKLPKPSNVFFNATYLFASETLNVDAACGVVTAFLDSPRVSEIVFIDSNSTADIARENYAIFKKRMKGTFTRTSIEDVKIRYRKKRQSDDVITANYKRQLLRFKG